MPDASPSPQVQRFLDELKELQAIFVLGQRSLPFLEELFEFVQDITVLMEEVDAAIHEQTGDMPRATSRLKSVSEATELATNEILDLADDVLEALRNQKEGLETSAACFDGLAAADARLLALLQSELGDTHAGLLAEVEELMGEKKTLREEGAAELSTTQKAISTIRGKVNHIMMSLQVQDITAQQIASVNHLIESVRGRMGELLQNISSSSGERRSGPRGGNATDATTFDGEARYDHAPDRQHMADELVAELGEAQGDGVSTAEAPSLPGEDNGEDNGAAAASQDEIDALFGEQPASEKNGAAAEAPAGEAASQNDIDEMFSNYGLPGNSSSAGEGEDAEHPSEEGAEAGEAASADDIDQIFQQNA